MRTILRTIALLLLIIFVLALPVSLLMREVGSLLFDPETTKAVIEDAFLGEEFIGRALSDAVEEMLLASAEDGGSFGSIPQRVLGELEDEDWEEITAVIIPQALLAEMSDSILDAALEWLNSDAEFPLLVIDLTAWKENANLHADQVVGIILDALPDCTVEELASQIFEGLSSENEMANAIPLCNPPEPLYSTIKGNANDILGGLLSNAPDSIEVNSAQFMALEQLQQVKSTLKQARAILSRTWLVVLGLGGLAIIMAARTMQEVFKWLGWPALLAGLGTLLLSFSLGLLADGAIAGLLSGVLIEAPAAAGAIVGNVVEEIIGQLSSPLLIQGAIITSIGLVALLSVNFLPVSEKKAKNID